MFTGVQFSLYPMVADFVPAIMRGIGALDAYPALRRETDNLSTLLVGPPDDLVPALRDCFLAAARAGDHVVMSGTLSRGCPGESDDPICIAPALPPPRPDENAADVALSRFKPRQPAVIKTFAQISLYPLGTEAHMARIGSCIDFLKRAGVFDRSKHFCSKIAGDAEDVFAAIERCYLDFAPLSAHVVLTFTISAHSPSDR